MKIRRYQGATWAEAFQGMKDDLGSEAVILYTHLPRPKRPWRWWAKEKFEIIAGTGVRVIETARATPGGNDRPTRIHPNVARGQSRDTPSLPPPPPGPAAARRAPSLSLLSTPLSKVASSLSPGEAAVAFDSLRRMIGELKDCLKYQDYPANRDELFPLYVRLLESGVPSCVAKRLIARLRDEVPVEKRGSTELARDRLRNLIRELLQASPIRLVEGRQSVTFLVGPTGVGKTTTVAKLAADFSIKQGKDVALLTIDTYRIAAVEQLRKITEIIKVPLFVVKSVQEVRDALKGCQDKDVVLIDTAGRSPRDSLKIRDLKRFIDAASPTETHLVLSLTHHQANLADTVRRFSSCGFDKLLLTKLDEASCYGTILDVQQRAQKALSYVTTGQMIPSDLRVADPEHLAELIVGNNNGSHGSS